MTSSTQTITVDRYFIEYNFRNSAHNGPDTIELVLKDRGDHGQWVDSPKRIDQLSLSPDSTVSIFKLLELLRKAGAVQ